jgi:hypothetical protein
VVFTLQARLWHCNFKMSVAHKFFALICVCSLWSGTAVASQSAAGLRGGIIGLCFYGKASGNHMLDFVMLLFAGDQLPQPYPIIDVHVPERPCFRFMVV